MTKTCNDSNNGDGNSINGSGNNNNSNGSSGLFDSFVNFFEEYPLDSPPISDAGSVQLLHS